MYIWYHHIPYRHLHPDHPVRSIQTIIDPVFIMVLISPFVVQPCKGNACRLTFCIIRTSVSLIILTADFEFRPAIFGKIMQKPLPIKSHAETMFHYEQFMPRDRAKMSYRFHIFATCFFLPFSALPFSTVCFSSKIAGILPIRNAMLLSSNSICLWFSISISANPSS